MNSEIKQKWIAALRGGEYKQGKCYLCKNGNFCCLGVLCDIHAKETGGQWTGESITKIKLYFDHLQFLPTEVLLWSRLKWKEMGVLINLNDSKGCSFLEIAENIEKLL